MFHKADLVLEGGDTKGLGLLGAVTRLMEQGYSLMEQGYTFPRVAGTSAGLILARSSPRASTPQRLVR